MGDPEGLVEFSVYALVVALALPLVQHLEAFSPTLAAVFLILAVLPIPAWFIGVRFDMPDWVARIIVWDCWFVLACIAVAAIAFVVSKLIP